MKLSPFIRENLYQECCDSNGFLFFTGSEIGMAKLFSQKLIINFVELVMGEQIIHPFYGFVPFVEDYKILPFRRYIVAHRVNSFGKIAWAS
jgi:hypothetical protein